MLDNEGNIEPWDDGMIMGSNGPRAADPWEMPSKRRRRMPEYLIEESVIKAISNSEIPNEVWALFGGGPILRKTGVPFTRNDHQFVIFHFGSFELTMSADDVTKIED